MGLVEAYLSRYTPVGPGALPALAERPTTERLAKGDCLSTLVGEPAGSRPRPPPASRVTAGTPSDSPLIPRVGMLATVRNRHGLISSVEPFDGAREGRLHVVTVEYADADGSADDQLVWEREPGARLLEPTALPDPEASPPMPPDELAALVRASRWTALTPFLAPADAGSRLTDPPIVAPFHGAIQVEDFQLVPLLKALRMPRVTLLLADDVGLGKTIEAGLILTELLLRRRVRRVLVICPASLRAQWRQEMHQKFALGFDEVDRTRTHALRKRLGLDANPWRVFSRIVTSYDYLKQPDVLEEFRAACHVPEGSPHLPWDLLIVDEAHNLAPAAFGADSDLSRMLGLIAPYFEHRLFLTATPHNGHTRCFSGLMERLDPVRFSRTTELSPAERSRVEEVVIRRLKREINASTDPPRFGERHVKAIPLMLGAEERELAATFQQFRKAVRSLVAAASRGEQLAGAFAVEILGKRLLSCPVAFADSWRRYREGLAEPDGAETSEVRAAERAVRETTADDGEAESRAAHAARTVGAWLQPMAAHLQQESKAIDAALRDLGLDGAEPPGKVVPRHDARFDALSGWIDTHLRDGTAWRTDERLIVFTEYKTTLDYLVHRLTARYPGEGIVRELYGRMDQDDRDVVKAAFNDPADPVRILVATDAASEGLNLQETARFLLHYDVPWNPSRLEQRNGRLDRHGQARDVVVSHFATDDDADLRFLAYVVGKVDAIREDLGSVGDVFDAAFQRRFIEGESVDSVRQAVERGVDRVKGRSAIPRDATIRAVAQDGKDEEARLRTLAADLDLDPPTLRDTLDVALGIGVGRPRLEPAGSTGRVRLRHPFPDAWQTVIDESLRLPRNDASLGPVPGLTFDPAYFIKARNGRPVFLPERDTTLIHLAHPLVQRALASFARARFPGSAANASRWTVTRDTVPSGAEALLLLTVEELAVNELRESFHHWVRTLRIPVHAGAIGHVLPYVAPSADRSSATTSTPEDVARACAIWHAVARDARRLVDTWAKGLTARVERALAAERDAALARERERFQSRHGELSKLMEQQTLARLEREIAGLERERQQGDLFDAEERLAEMARSQRAKEEELERRTAHYVELRTQLDRERTRVLEHVLPRRYTMRGGVHVFPVTVEIRLSAEAAKGV